MLFKRIKERELAERRFQSVLHQAAEQIGWIMPESIVAVETDEEMDTRSSESSQWELMHLLEPMFQDSNSQSGQIIET